MDSTPLTITLSWVERVISYISKFGVPRYDTFMSRKISFCLNELRSILNRSDITGLRPAKRGLVPPAGIEPAARASEAHVLSVELRGHFATLNVYYFK